VLAEAVWRLPADPALAAALEDAVLPPVLAAGCVTVPQIKRRVRRAVLALDPSTAEQRHQRAVAERRVEYHPGEDGMASLTALLPAPEAQVIYDRLTTATTLFPDRGHPDAGPATRRPVHRRDTVRPAARRTPADPGPAARHQRG